MKQEIVRNLRTLKVLAKKGFIELHGHTGKRVNSLCGPPAIAWYVESVASYGTFEHAGNTYRATFVDGCFLPYITIIS